MMKKLATLICVVCLVNFVHTAGATLIDYGNGVLFDSTNNLYWYQKLPELGDMNKGEQLGYIDDLDIMVEGEGSSYRFDAWEMADPDQLQQLYFDNTTREIADIFDWTGRDDTGQTVITSWFGRFDGIVGVPEWTVFGITSLGDGDQFPHVTWLTRADDNSHESLGAWVVTDSFTPVPEPSTTILLGTCLAAFAGLRLRRKKK